VAHKIRPVHDRKESPDTRIGGYAAGKRESAMNRWCSSRINATVKGLSALNESVQQVIQCVEREVNLARLE